MKRIALVVMALLFSAQASAFELFKGWTATEQWVFGANVACNAYDAAQTSWAMGEPGFKEVNPLYGEDPSERTLVAAKLLGAGVLWWSVHDDSKYRKHVLIATTVLCLGVIAHNHSEGARP